MRKHILIGLNEIIYGRIVSLTEEVEVAISARMNPPYIIDRKDELESLRWTTRIIRWILDRATDGRQQLGVNKETLELENTRKFENMVHDKIQELEVKLEDVNSLREKEVLRNEIENLNCVLGHLFNLRSDCDEAHTIEIREVNSNFQQTNHERKQLIKTEINAQTRLS